MTQDEITREAASSHARELAAASWAKTEDRSARTAKARAAAQATYARRRAEKAAARESEKE